MKVKYELPAIIFGLFFLSIFLSPSSAKAQYGDEVSLETFYEELSPYGVWINDPQYGRVWRPDVDQDEFRPYYSRGRWEMTKYGNTWVSDYDWGWAPFHYGRWLHSGRRGWLWVPGTQWGPAWVSWRSGGGHYGWAPLGPGMNINLSISRIPDYYWVFVPQRSIYYNSYPRYDRRRNVNIYHNTVIINNTYVYNRHRYYTGPRAEEIRRITRQPVTIHDVRNQGPGRYVNTRNNRPEVDRGSVQSPRPSRPTNVDRGATSGAADHSIVDRSTDNRGAVNGRPATTINNRPTDQSVSRGTAAGRPGTPVTERPREESVSRPGDQKLSGSSQRTSRTYDNQEVRGNQSGQREREEIVERPQPTNRPSPPAREQSSARPQQREVSRDNSSQPSQSPTRSSASEGKTTERSSSGGARPGRVQ